MKKNNSGKPAMPYCVNSGYIAHESGLTKREYFAGLAMQGLFVKDDVDINNAARYAVFMADALLSALECTK